MCEMGWIGENLLSLLTLKWANQCKRTHFKTYEHVKLFKTLSRQPLVLMCDAQWTVGFETQQFQSIYQLQGDFLSITRIRLQ